MPFAKGQSGNPGGRKADKPWRDALMLAVNEADGDKKKLRKIAEALVEQAMDGDVSAIKEIGDRIDGKPKQQIEHSGDAENPVAVAMSMARESLVQKLLRMGAK